MHKLFSEPRERKDRPGKWIIVLHSEGRRSTRTYDSAAEALEAYRKLKRAEAKGALRAAAPKPQTLTAICDAFLASKKNEGARPDTLDTYRGLLTRTVLPALGPDRSPRDLSERDVEQYRDSRLATPGISPTTVRSEMDRLRALLGYAKAQGLVRENVADRVKPPKAREEQKDWLRSSELGPFLDACVGEFAMIARLAIFTGLRRREVVYLQRADIDLANGVIHIRRKTYLGFQPKSGRERGVPIDPTLRPVLERHLREQVGPGSDAWVFPQRIGERKGQRRSNRTRWFAVATSEAARRAGLGRPLTFHDLRRTYGAMLIEAGVGIYEVSRLLGHSDVRITQKVYAPICGKFLAAEAAKLGRYLAPALIREVPQVPALKMG